jgi:hypothetical protein
MGPRQVGTQNHDDYDLNDDVTYDNISNESLFDSYFASSSSSSLSTSGNSTLVEKEQQYGLLSSSQLSHSYLSSSLSLLSPTYSLTNNPNNNSSSSQLSTNSASNFGFPSSVSSSFDLVSPPYSLTSHANNNSNSSQLSASLVSNFSFSSSSSSSSSSAVLSSAYPLSSSANNNSSSSSSKTYFKYSPRYSQSYLSAQISSTKLLDCDSDENIKKSFNYTSADENFYLVFDEDTKQFSANFLRFFFENALNEFNNLLKKRYLNVGEAELKNYLKQADNRIGQALTKINKVNYFQMNASDELIKEFKKEINSLLIMLKKEIAGLKESLEKHKFKTISTYGVSMECEQQSSMLNKKFDQSYDSYRQQYSLYTEVAATVKKIIEPIITFPVSNPYAQCIGFATTTLQGEKIRLISLSNPNKSRDLIGLLNKIIQIYAEKIQENILPLEDDASADFHALIKNCTMHRGHRMEDQWDKHCAEMSLLSAFVKLAAENGDAFEMKGLGFMRFYPYSAIESNGPSVKDRNIAGPPSAKDVGETIINGSYKFYQLKSCGYCVQKTIPAFAVLHAAVKYNKTQPNNPVMLSPLPDKVANVTQQIKKKRLFDGTDSSPNKRVCVQSGNYEFPQTSFTHHNHNGLNNNDKSYMDDSSAMSSSSSSSSSSLPLPIFKHKVSQSRFGLFSMRNSPPVSPLVMSTETFTALSFSAEPVTKAEISQDGMDIAGKAIFQY